MNSFFRTANPRHSSGGPGPLAKHGWVQWDRAVLEQRVLPQGLQHRAEPQEGCENALGREQGSCSLGRPGRAGGEMGHWGIRKASFSPGAAFLPLPSNLQPADGLTVAPRPTPQPCPLNGPDRALQPWPRETATYSGKKVWRERCLSPSYLSGHSLMVCIVLFCFGK